MAFNWDATKKKVQEEGMKAVTEAADVALLKIAADNDRDRDNQFTEIEKIRRQEAKKRYDEQLVDKRLVKAALIPRTGEVTPIINFMFNPNDLSLGRSVTITIMDGARTVRGLPKVNFGYVEPYKLQLTGILFDTYETGENVLTKIQPLLDAVDFSKFKDPFQEEEVTVTVKDENGNSKSKSYKYQERIVKLSSSETAMKSIVGSLGGNDVLGAREYGSEKVGDQALEMRRPPVFYFIWGEKNYMCCMVQKLDYKLTMFLPNGTPVRAMVTINLEEVDLGVASRAFSKRQKYLNVK